jgi:hypothetical protein
MEPVDRPLLRRLAPFSGLSSSTAVQVVHPLQKPQRGGAGRAADDDPGHLSVNDLRRRNADRRAQALFTTDELSRVFDWPTDRTEYTLATSSAQGSYTGKAKSPSPRAALGTDQPSPCSRRGRGPAVTAAPAAPSVSSTAKVTATGTSLGAPAPREHRRPCPGPADAPNPRSARQRTQRHSSAGAQRDRQGTEVPVNARRASAVAPQASGDHGRRGTRARSAIRSRAGANYPGCCRARRDRLAAPTIPRQRYDGGAPPVAKEWSWSATTTFSRG